MASKKGTSGGRRRKSASSKDAVARHKAERGVIDNIWGVILMVAGVFLAASVFTGAAGQVGEAIGTALRGVFGFVGYIFPFYLIFFGILLFMNKTVHISWMSVILGALALLMLCLINSGRFIDASAPFFAPRDFYDSGVELKSGGFFGMMLGNLIVKYLGKVGLYCIAVAALIVIFLLMLNTPVSRAIEKIRDKSDERRIRNEEKRQEEEAYYDEQARQLEQRKTRVKESKGTEPAYKALHREGGDYRDKRASYGKQLSVDDIDSIRPAEDGASAGIIVKSYGIDEPRAELPGYGLGEDEGKDLQGGIRSSKGAPADTGLSSAAADGKAPRKMSNREAGEAVLTAGDFNPVKKSSRYRRPPVDLLINIKRSSDSGSRAALDRRAAILEETLRNFNVDARVVNVTQGPAVTRYEIQPNVGVKVSSIVRLADDIALNLRAKSIRIEAPIPGKAAVGIEVENEKINMVSIRELIDSREFRQSTSKISFAVGRDIAGKAIVADLKSMPHLLIAGSTGSGKSVCINCIITSILYKADPDEVKLVLIDPKVVELGNYNGIPHLLIPVVTDPNKAAAALNWAVAEMTDRYKKFADAKVKDLESYNEHMLRRGDREGLLPQVVIIIDELADLMMAAPSQVEESICRLAQLARAAGMHLIVATQRPSVDIITGLIKANIPSRIAFAVSSQFDSRTILDMGGAEKLVGRGDMLFSPIGLGKPVRVQGCFISDDEVQAVIDHVKAQVEDVSYSEAVLDRIERGNTELQSDRSEDEDELMQDAIDCVVAAGQASVSMLQRRFRIGYNRAARIVDAMEARGIIGPQDGSRPRQVLVSQDTAGSGDDKGEGTVE